MNLVRTTVMNNCGKLDFSSFLAVADLELTPAGEAENKKSGN